MVPVETVKQQLPSCHFRKATRLDTDRIWTILQHAIAKRAQEGSGQWQDGYPNRDTVEGDIEKNHGHVLEVGGTIVAYVAVIFDGEPDYEKIQGTWLSSGRYTVVHRLAVAQDVDYRGLGTLVMRLVENVSKQAESYSVKVDTNHDNEGMLRIFEKLGYEYCGEVVLRGTSRRKAFEKRLDKT